MPSPTHIFGRLHETIRQSDRILLIAHKKPDGDTLGASSSVLNWLLREGKNPTMFCLDAPAPAFRYIDNIHQYTADPSVFDTPYDLVIVFDSGDLRYCGVDQFIPRLPPGYVLVNIDHHVTNAQFGHMNLVFTDASSTAEVVHRFFEENNIFIDPRMATSILTGLLTDTSNFTNPATNPKTIDIAGKMLSNGARVNDINAHVLHDKTIPMLRIWGLYLSRLRYNPRYDVVTTYMLKEDLNGVPKETVDGIANFLNAVASGTDTILVLNELEGDIVKGSFRAVKRDVSKVAKLLGGGGHKLAAAFTIKGKIQETPNGPRIISI